MERELAWVIMCWSQAWSLRGWWGCEVDSARSVVRCLSISVSSSLASSLDSKACSTPLSVSRVIPGLSPCSSKRSRVWGSMPDRRSAAILTKGRKDIFFEFLPMAEMRGRELTT